MNIQEAKEEIIHTIMAYTARSPQGGYAIPPRHQRPVLLIGPPGIGKTAVMQQAADECGVGFVSYTMTHHTRQSAVGLPLIKNLTFGGKEYSVTEYTMSEIIASVYRCMEENGQKEGLLFLDEINCVSETLAPAMLQFLQNKTFGSHRLPDGWILAAAGNPPEYNKSVREFDIATLDRLKYITVEADYDAWRAYALESGVHASIPSYLDVHRDRFYILRQTYTDKTFATARGWEDLSLLLLQYESLRLPVTPALIGQYLHAEDLARDFAGYYQFFISRKNALPVSAMLHGDPQAHAVCLRLLADAPFEEKLLFVHLALSSLCGSLQSWDCSQKQLRLFSDALERLVRFQKQQKLPSLIGSVKPFLEKEEEVLAVRRRHGLSPDEEIRQTRQVLYEVRDLAYRFRSGAHGPEDPDLPFFEEEKERRAKALLSEEDSLSHMLERCAILLEEADGPELTLFVSSIGRNRLAVSFLKKHPSPRYGHLMERLQFESREEKLKQELNSIL